MAIVATSVTGNLILKDCLTLGKIVTVTPTPNNFFQVHGVPNYYEIYVRWMNHYRETSEITSKSLAYHYARVAEEMGQATIDDDITVEITIP